MVTSYFSGLPETIFQLYKSLSVIQEKRIFFRIKRGYSQIYDWATHSDYVLCGEILL